MMHDPLLEESSYLWISTLALYVCLTLKTCVRPQRSRMAHWSGGMNRNASHRGRICQIIQEVEAGRGIMEASQKIRDQYTDEGFNNLLCSRINAVHASSSELTNTSCIGGLKGSRGIMEASRKIRNQYTDEGFNNLLCRIIAVHALSSELTKYSA
ncbi:hypothetical protein F5880DRAFT_884996 [Lentinula raphanica]|nr:hypothetical protein F5880DRAFT_884996 [Lentinula raphanica]